MSKDLIRLSDGTPRATFQDKRRHPSDRTIRFPFHWDRVRAAAVRRPGCQPEVLSPRDPQRLRFRGLLLPSIVAAGTNGQCGYGQNHGAMSPCLSGNKPESPRLGRNIREFHP